jgi:hypothetical protein
MASVGRAGESGKGDQMDKQTLLAVLQFLKKYDLKVLFYLFYRLNGRSRLIYCSCAQKGSVQPALSPMDRAWILV